MAPYPRQVEHHMKSFYNSLSEKDRRRYAAVEAEKLGHGGLQYIAELFVCDPDIHGITTSKPISIAPNTAVRPTASNWKGFWASSRDANVAFDATSNNRTTHRHVCLSAQLQYMPMSQATTCWSR